MTGQEIVEFSEAINLVFTPDEFDTLMLRLDKRLRDYVPIAGVLFLSQLQQLLAIAVSQAWILQLVAEVIRARGHTQTVKQFLINHPQWDNPRNPTAGHPCDTLRILGGKCFIGRDAFRKFLKKSEDITEKRVLVVTSDHRKIGKTYSKDLIDYLAAKRALLGVAYIDVDRLDLGENNNDSARLAAEIARLIRREGSIPAPSLEQPPKGNTELVQWLVPNTPPEGGRMWWIVLDGFRDKQPAESVQEFVSQLAQRVQGSVYFGLILLNYEYPLPLSVAAFAAKEKIKPIVETDVKAFLSRVYESKYGVKPKDQAIKEYVTDTYDRHREYAQQYPDAADDQLLLNMAVADATELILEGAI